MALQDDSPQLHPLVSVIIPAYNAAQFIERTLKSVLNQTYRNLEVLVIDDGSTDNTADLVQHFAATDKRLVLYQRTNAGVAAARNHGIAKAQGEFMAPLDADDTWQCTNIEKQVQVLTAADEAVAMVYSWSVDIDETDCLTGGTRISPYHGNIYPALLYENIIGNASACLIRRCCFEILGGYSSDLRAQQAQGCEDWDMYLRIAKHYQVEVIPELLVGYRRVSGSMSTQTEAMAKSRQLTFKSVEEQFPQVWRKVTRWMVSAAHLHEARQCFRAHQDAASCHAFFQAFQSDWLNVLTAYNSCALLIKMIWRYLTGLLRPQGLGSKQPLRHNEAKSLSPQCVTVQKQYFPVSKSQRAYHLLGSKLTIYLRLFLGPLFLSWLLRRFRIRWVAARVCTQRPMPQALSFWTVMKPRITVQLRSQHPNCQVDFSQSRIAS